MRSVKAMKKIQYLNWSSEIRGGLAKSLGSRDELSNCIGLFDLLRVFQ